MRCLKSQMIAALFWRNNRDRTAQYRNIK